MKQQISVRLGDFAPIQSSRTLTSEGFLLCAAAKMAKAPQVRPYLVAEFGNIEGYAPDQVIQVYTSAEELFNPKTIQSFEQVDATVTHPPGNSVNAATWSEFSVGTVSAVRQEGEYLVADLVIKDQTLIQQIQNNQQIELSLGYTAELFFCSGISPDGCSYQAVFKQIVGDHVALVANGRCGADCRIGDEQTTTENSTSETTLDQQTMQIMVDDQVFHVANNPDLARAIAQQNQKIAQYQSATITIGEQTLLVFEALNDIQAQVDQLLLDNQQLREQNNNPQTNPLAAEQLQHIADARIKMIQDAKKLHPGVMTEGFSCIDIKRSALTAHIGDAVLQAILADIELTDANDEHIDLAFRALTAKLAQASDLNSLSIALQQTVGDAALEHAMNGLFDYDKSAAWKMN